MARSTKGILAASAMGAVAAIAGIIIIISPNMLGGSTSQRTNDTGSTTTVASTGQAPNMVLVVLKGDEDSSGGTTQYMANNSQPIHLAGGAHIRFDSPEYRTAESMRVIARNVDGGTIDLLRKSYDVNNEFFINVNKGHYNLQVQATWFEKGTFFYQFDVLVV